MKIDCPNLPAVVQAACLQLTEAMHSRASRPVLLHLDLPALWRFDPYVRSVQGLRLLGAMRDFAMAQRVTQFSVRYVARLTQPRLTIGWRNTRDLTALPLLA